MHELCTLYVHRPINGAINATKQGCWRDQVVRPNVGTSRHSLSLPMRVVIGDLYTTKSRGL